MQISTCFLAWNFAFFPGQDSNYSKICCSTAFNFILTLCIALRIVFLYTTHCTQNILLTHVLVCWFTVLVLVLSVTVLVLNLNVLVLVLVLSLLSWSWHLLSCSHHWSYCKSHLNRSLMLCQPQQTAPTIDSHGPRK